MREVPERVHKSISNTSLSLFVVGACGLLLFGISYGFAVSAEGADWVLALLTIPFVVFFLATARWLVLRPVVVDGHELVVRELGSNDRIPLDDIVSVGVADTAGWMGLPLVGPMVLLRDGSEVEIGGCLEYIVVPGARRRAERDVWLLSQMTGKPIRTAGDDLAGTVQGFGG